MNKKDMFSIIRSHIVFIISLAISIFIIVYGYIQNHLLNEVSGQIMSWVSEKFGWLYILVVVALIFFLAWVAFGRFGNIKLGKDDDVPEYSNFSWFAMLFCGSTGIGLVFWSIAEPLSHYTSPPQGIKAETVEAAEFSIRTCFLHWGITQWVCFAIVGLGIAYFQYRKNTNSQISNVLVPLFGKKAINGLVGKVIDIFAVLVSVAGVATSLGLGVSQICGGLNYLWKVPNNKNTYLIIIITITCVFLASAISGINKGIKLLSNINTWIAIALLVLGFLVGPHSAILNTLVSGTGQHIQNLIGDTTMISTFGDNTWVMNWRVFYFAWFIAWTPFVGMFIARISKGRTVREFLLGVVVIPTVVTIIWLSVFGTIALSTGGGYSHEELVKLIASPETAVFIVFEQYPLSKVMSVLVIVLLAIFFITSADSATFSLSMMTSDGVLNPPKWKKIVWALVEAAMAYVLLSVGSLKPLQTISIAATLPFLLVIIAMCPAIVKEMKKDMTKEVKESEEKNMIFNDVKIQVSDKASANRGGYSLTLIISELITNFSNVANFVFAWEGGNI